MRITKKINDNVIQIFLLDDKGYCLSGVQIWILEIFENEKQDSYIEFFPKFYEIFYKVETFLKYLKENKKEIKEKIRKVCEEKKINFNENVFEEYYKILLNDIPKHFILYKLKNESPK